MTLNARLDFKIGFDFLKCFKIECFKIELRLRLLSETRPYDHTKSIISNEVDYNFFSKIQFTLNSKNDFFAHVIELKLIIVQIRNAFDTSFIIFKNFRIGKLQNYIEEDFYMIRLKNRHLTIVSQSIDIKKLADLSIKTSKKTILSNEIIVYNDIMICQQVNAMIDAYFKIWNAKSKIINISFEEWMKINTISKTKSESSRVYKLGDENKVVINKKFDSYQKMKKMNWTMSSTSYVYSAFVVWTTIRLSNKSFMKKKRVVVNIRRLNKIFEFDAYSMSLQADIISCV